MAPRLLDAGWNRWVSGLNEIDGTPRKKSLSAEQQAQNQQHPSQAELPAFGLEPFAGGVRAAALPARPNRDRRQAERKRDIGVGRGAVQVAVDPQMRIHRPQIFKDRRVLGESAARAG